MSKGKKIISFLLAILLIFSATYVFADNEVANNEVTTNTTNSVDNSVIAITNSDNSYKKNDVYLCGNDLTVDYTVDGNLFAVGNTVTINAPVGGDAFIMAKKVIVGEKGYVFNNLFVAAESVDIKGVLYDTFALTKKFTISNSKLSDGSDKIGYIYRDARICCNELDINGSIGRNGYINCGSVKFNTDGNNKGVIYGDLNYSSKTEAKFGTDLIKGKVNFTSTAVSINKIIARYISNLGAFILFVIFVWLICLWLAPKFLQNTNKYVGKITWKVLGIGLLTLLAIPLISILLFSLKITANISLFLMAFYIVILAISSPIFVITANNYICEKSKVDRMGKKFGMLILTSAVVGVFSKLPFVGPIVACIVTILGLGVLVSSVIPKKDENKKAKKETKKSSKESK